MKTSPAPLTLEDLRGLLDIELTEHTEPIGTLLNEKAPPSARIVSVKLRALDPDTFKPLRKSALLDQVIIEEPVIVLKTLGGEMSHNAPNGSSFTVRDVFAAIEKTELETRGNTEWFGGIDVHHVFLEGLEREWHTGQPCCWRIYWGS